MVTRDPDAPFDTPNVVIGRQDRNELTLSFRPDPYLSTLLCRCVSDAERHGVGQRRVRQEQGAGPAVDVLLRGLLREPKTLLCCAASYLEVPL